MKHVLLCPVLLFQVCFALSAAATEPQVATNVPPPAVTLEDFRLMGDLRSNRAAFTLTATARVDNSKGGSLEVLSGNVALTDFAANLRWRLRSEPNRFILQFDRSGRFPIELKFNAAVRQADGWDALEFRVAPSSLQPIVLQGLAADTQFQFLGAARPERSGEDFVSYLPLDGLVKLSWKEAPTETEGKLFYAAEMLSQVSVSPGLMRQTALLDFKIMQGEMNRLSLLLKGPGEVTRVQGDGVLAWNVESVPNSTDHRLVVQLNRPQKDQFALQVQMQTPLAAFPLTADVTYLRPEGATRFAGYFRITNEGAVRLEVLQANGVSQVSPDQFPETDLTKSALRVTGNQRFVYRFSGPDHSLRIQADQTQPEVTVSEVLAYRFGENDLSIDTELELDIREAPIRELLLRVPKGYVVARLNSAGLSDYFLRETEGEPDAELRLIYGQPVTGRQLIQLRLERNKPLGETTWVLPRVELAKAKSVRGHIAISADPGYRLSPDRTRALTEIATAFFPRKLAGIQSAFRLSDAAWEATLRVERLPQSVQADALHLFSIGEGVAYSSSVINYVISGAPISTFKVQLADDYLNVEFTGKDLRSWQKIDGGYQVQLHTPVSGPYTLLATYERPLKSQGDTLTFTGLRPLDAQSEQGYTLIISAYQFQVQPSQVSPGLVPLETAEVPSEYRLFFDAPILAAYRYTARPFDLTLALKPLPQGDSLNQVVDRASLISRISKEGQVITDVRYYLKNRGNPNLRLSLPPGTELWSASVNGATVVPVTDAQSFLVPLPQRVDPNQVLAVALKLASRSRDARNVSLASPVLGAPVLLAQWQLTPDTSQRLNFRRGSLAPVGGVPEVSGFAALMRALTGYRSQELISYLLMGMVLAGASFLAWRWASGRGAYRLSARHVSGLLLGLVAFGAAELCLVKFADLAGHERVEVSRSLTFLAPVQQAGSGLTIEVANVEDKAAFAQVAGYAWPAVVGLLAWIWGAASANRMARSMAPWAGWFFLAWAALRAPVGLIPFTIVLLAFLLWQLAVPALRLACQVPARPPEPDTAGSPPPPTIPPSAASAVPLLLAGLFWIGQGTATEAYAWSWGRAPSLATATNAVADRLTQEIRIENDYAFTTARFHWQAFKGQKLPLVFEPAVVTEIQYPSNQLTLARSATGTRVAQELIATRNGVCDVVLRYQLQVKKAETQAGIVLPTRCALVNELTVTVVNQDVDVTSAQAVSTRRELVSSNTVAKLVLAPTDDAVLEWKARSRDLKREKPVYYAEFSQLYVPAAGVVEGVHAVAIRPAQGELTELLFSIPSGATITDVLGPPISSGRVGGVAGIVSLWRFDPDAGKLRITLNPPQSRPFSLTIRSQVATGPLPFTQGVGLISLDQAAGQVGLLGVATGADVQLDSVEADGFSPVNLEDFPNEASAPLAGRIAGLTVRRAFRYADSQAKATLKASPVESDVRVETQDTLSLSDDRSVLAVNAAVDITRAGIFRLSFLLPAAFDVETITSPALSHWTDLKTDAGRLITLNLAGKTEGQQTFAISLAGPGVKATNGWVVPQLVWREAAKQRGTLLLVPEQGLRLQVATSEGLTQLDPQKSGIQQKGVLAFRILQSTRRLALNIEQVEPWIQVTSLQHINVNEAQMKVAANLQYQIENTGLKAFRVYLPTNADNVQFQGDQVADFLVVPGTVTNSLQAWEIKLHRRVIGSYLLQVRFQHPLSDQVTEATYHGVQAANVNLQRGFVAVQSTGRLQLRVDNPPAALQPAEWQSVPRALQQDIPGAAANFTYRLVEPEFDLPLKLERHEPAKLLAARVNSVTLSSVLSESGVLLTQARLDLLPGDKRLLHVRLPAGARFWFAFVSRNGVWPWRSNDDILIPLEQPSSPGQSVPVEIFYSAQLPASEAKRMDFELVAPKFDLPLEDITWSVALNDKWTLKHWTGSLQLQREDLRPLTVAADLQGYLDTEAALQRERTKEAETMLQAGNSALEKGEPQQARRAFQAAYSLSSQDAAFNEDARVQLHNVKLQQALIGLNVRQAGAAGGETGTVVKKLRDLRGRADPAYTQQEAKDILDRNSAEENATLMRVAERLIQQQDAAIGNPAALRANLPEQGRVLTFKRAVAVDNWADLRLQIGAGVARGASWQSRFVILCAAALVVLAFGLAGRSLRRE